MKPFAHQLKEFRIARYARKRALFWRQRTGKSKAVIDSACALFEGLEINGVLVIAPNGVHRNWTDIEVPEHQTCETNRFAWRFSNPRNEKDFLLWSCFLGVRKRMHWMAVNMEALIRPEVKKAIKLFKKTIGPAMLVIDESHHFGHAGTKRTAIARGLGRQFEYCRILTGTPVENSPLRAFSQFEILEREALGRRTYGTFKDEFAEFIELRGTGGHKFQKLSKYKNLDLLRDRMAKYTSVVLRSDCPDLPEVQQVPRLVELTPKQYEYWNKIKKEEIEFLINNNDSKPLVGGAAFIKLQQVEGGFYRHPDGRVESLCAKDTNPKMLILQDELEQYDGQVIVWFQFTHELEAAYALLGDVAVRYHGKVSDGERQLSMKLFREGKKRVFLGQPKAAGEGLKIMAGLMIWYSQTPDAVVRAQASERATLMGGQSVQMVDMYAPGGIDQHFLGITDRKTSIADDMSREGMRRTLESLNI